jgi:hypothetical protein
MQFATMSWLTGRGIGYPRGTRLRTVNGQTGIHKVIATSDYIHSHVSIAEMLTIVHDEYALHRDFVVARRQQQLPIVAIPTAFPVESGIACEVVD